MKKVVLMIIMCFAFVTNSFSQAIYNEVTNLMKQNRAIANKDTEKLETRLVAVFKADALYYLITKAGENETFTEHELGEQANAMIEFVNKFVKELSQTKKNNVPMLRVHYKDASLKNSKFNDMEKEITYAYVDKPNYITPFSLDTDWLKALEEVK